MNETDRRLIDAWNDADNLERRGDWVGALARLREVISSTDMGLPSPTRRDDGIVQFAIDARWLALRARESFLALSLGQGGEAPHQYLAMYESLSPQLPESSSVLRFWMGRLRVAVALDHGRHHSAMEWALDLLDVLAEEPSLGSRAEALGNLAVSASGVGLRATAARLYAQAMEAAASPADAAGVKSRHASFLYNGGDAAAAATEYTEVVDVLEAVDDPTPNDLLEIVGARSRRAELRVAAQDYTAAVDDARIAAVTLEQARALTAYASARAIDQLVEDELMRLTQTLRGVPTDIEGLHAAVGEVLLRMTNSALAALNRRETPGSAADLDSDPDPRPLPDLSTSALARARLAKRWYPIEQHEVDAFLHGDPTVMIVATNETEDELEGLTVLVGNGGQKLVRWTVQDEAASVLRDLLRPSPARDAEPGAWGRPTSDPIFELLGRALLPVESLRQSTEGWTHGLRYAPYGPMWRLPIGALIADGEPLGTRVPLVATTPGARSSAPAARALTWAGHFDLALTWAVSDLTASLRRASELGVDLRLVDEPGEAIATADVFLFSGHGHLSPSGQLLRFASGATLSGPQVRAMKPGSSVLLNACWTGTVNDETGSDPVDLVLSMLGAGANSVLSALGPISDTYAARFFKAVVDRLGPDTTLPVAHQQAVRCLLEADPELPLTAWAPFVTVARTPYHR